MEVRKIEGTYTEQKEADWFGAAYECNECGAIFMTLYDEVKCFCPSCGRFLIWNEADKDEQ